MGTRRYSPIFEQSAVIERVARIVSSVRGTKPDYTRLAAELEQAIPFDVFGVVLLRHDRQAVRVTVCQKEARAWVAEYHQHPLDGSKLQQMLQVPDLLVNDYPSGLDGLPAMLGDALSSHHQLRSTLIAPLLVEEHVLGTLELGSVAVGTYADLNLQRLVRAVVGVLATAIEGAQSGGSAQIQDRQRQALKEVTSSLASKMDLPTILNQIVSGIAEALNVASAIFMFDSQEQKLRLEAHAGLDEAVVRKLFSRSLVMSDNGIVSRTLKLRHPHVSQDIITDDRFPDGRNFFAELGMHSIFSHPLTTGTTVYGALLLCSPEPGGFTPLKADILSLFANQATVAIHNGKLLESARQRLRFQQAIEQLDQAVGQQNQEEAAQVVEDRQNNVGEERADADLALLRRVRMETQRTFGVSFISLLRLIGDHLLTRGERDLQSLLFAYQDEAVLQSDTVPMTNGSGPLYERKDAFTDTLALLNQTAEAALVRAGMLGELGRLLTQMQQTTNWVKESWFVVGLDGLCLCMNPAAEAFCDIHLETLTSTSYHADLSAISQWRANGVSIEHVFAKLLPRIRNAEEVSRYLQDFTQGNIYGQELRCILTTEPGDTHSTKQQSTYSAVAAESVSSDYYYQFIRYPLYNQQDQLEANALQVRDVTQQVRNEKNMSALLSSVSHDLRTPLTAIKAAVTGLLEPGLAWKEQDRHDMLVDIDCGADHLTVLVDALVALSRIEMGALVLQKEWCDLVEVGYGALGKLARLLAGRKASLQAQPNLPLLYVDHAQLEHVFYNLIENAVRRSPDCCEIRVLLDLVEQSGALLRVRVIDQGEAISERECERLFQSLDSLRSYGNGLGLAICKGIIDAHQGQIWVEEASEGTGSCFVFTLPTHWHGGLTRESVTSLQQAYKAMEKV